MKKKNKFHSLNQSMKQVETWFKMWNSPKKKKKPDSNFPWPEPVILSSSGNGEAPARPPLVTLINPTESSLSALISPDRQWTCKQVGWRQGGLRRLLKMDEFYHILLTPLHLLIETAVYHESAEWDLGLDFHPIIDLPDNEVYSNRYWKFAAITAVDGNKFIFKRNKYILDWWLSGEFNFCCRFFSLHGTNLTINQYLCPPIGYMCVLHLFILDFRL